MLRRMFTAVLAEAVEAQAKETKKAETREGLKLAAAMAVGAVGALVGVGFAINREKEKRYSQRQIDDLLDDLRETRETLREEWERAARARSRLHSEVNKSSIDAFKAEGKADDAIRVMDDLLLRVKELEGDEAEESPEIRRGEWRTTASE